MARWVRFAYPPYNTLSTHRYGGCATITHPTTPYQHIGTVGALRLPTLHHRINTSVRWVRVAYPPYNTGSTHWYGGALRLPTLQHLINTSVRWERVAYPPYTTGSTHRHGGCASLTHPTPPDQHIGTVGARRLPTLHYSGQNTRRAGKRSAPAITKASPATAFTSSLISAGARAISPEYRSPSPAQSAARHRTAASLAPRFRYSSCSRRWRQTAPSPPAA